MNNTRMRKGLMVLLMMSLYLHAHGQNLGSYGQVFPVIEEDIRHVIMKRLSIMQQTGELARHQHDIKQRIAEHAIRPKPLNLPSTVEPKTFCIDASVTVSRDVWTPDGMLLAKAGTQINPFQHIQFNKTLFFFNADDSNQMQWVRKHYRDYKQVKFILTGGDIRDASELLGRVYFDVNGVLIHKLHIKNVPSVVNQEGLYWQIKEIGAHDA
ncbi:type-F conjugative transfer system protein TraW [Legionella sp. PATHC038]|uniref:type-F conjugative transfer system protein TraW n=1 Tax=Legionella sheltonii TaxID=2992041 RepID=UPI0022441452|nr:type-F conjugative transfer system protein TraW [Legionella sp. PATHC038]MCW8400502.1 type-F conjugative transfer system protein TraW [Legionella sp. PATHC038]